MYLITSAALISHDLQSEFGPLPPSFLPVGNQRLFHYQLALIPSNRRIILTLPEGFELGAYDQQVLMQHQVEVLFLPAQLCLGESVVYALNLIEFNPQTPLYILHGDTLVDHLDIEPDSIGISQIDSNYDWAEYLPETGRLQQYSDKRPPASNLIANGVFSFANPRALVRHLIQANWNFIDGINGYHKEHKLTPVQFDTWYDFGHGHTYYQSKSRMTTQRSFNEMQICGQIVTKSSHKKIKLAAEIHWYQAIPGDLRRYTPQLLASQETDNSVQYSIEYLHLTALNELYVFSQLPAFAWRNILKACGNFLKQAQQYPQPEQLTLTDLFIGKTQERLQEFATEQLIALDSPLIINGETVCSINELARLSAAYLPTDNGNINVLHGDFCFSNILYDFRTCEIKVIDPRGLDANNQMSIYGNSYYDIAKLAHSILGLYDVIIAGYFEAELVDNKLDFKLVISKRRQQIMHDFINMMQQEFALNSQQLYAMQIQLFLSMLPLHQDRPDRQLGFIGNAYRLFAKMIALQPGDL
ncbi:MAG: phosphotransferase [Shewanella sp.]